MQQRAATPMSFALETPAKFSFSRASPPPSLPSGSQLELRRNQSDTTLVPLPTLPDNNLTDPAIIAGAHGYKPAVKKAGSRRQVKASKGKGKENDIIGVDNQSKKRSREVGEDDKEPRNKRGWPHGSNNYSNADIKVLLDFIEEELPLGQ
jgi:hypothetical protein